MFLTVLWFLVVLSVLVLAHEIGHFVAARRAGIRVQEFGLGIPPRLFGVRRNDTLFSINLLPLGGFVKMKGENGAPTAREDTWTELEWQRFAALWTMAKRLPQPEARRRQIALIKAYNPPVEEDDGDSFAGKSRSQRAVVLVAGVGMNLLIAPLLFAVAYMLGAPCSNCREVQVHEVRADSPAEQAGLQPGDTLLRMDGETIEYMEAVRAVVQRSLDQPLSITLLRDGAELTTSAVPRVTTSAPQGALGIALGPPIVRYPPWEALPLGVQRTGELLGLLIRGLFMIVTGQLAADVAGPVGIARLTGEAAQDGLAQLLNFTGFLSLNLAILNLLPIPGLDGARLAFVGLEALRGGRRVNPATEGIIHMVGLLLLIMLMVYISYRDIVQIIG